MRSITRLAPAGRLLTVALLFLTPAVASAQDFPAAAEKVVELEALVDSLRFRMRQLDTDLQGVKQDLVNQNSMVDLLSLLGEEEPENVPEDQRSRRRRVDSLLKAITQRPGQLRFNGGATAIVQGLLRGDTETAGSGSLDIFAHTSFGPRTLLFFDFEAIGGDGLKSLPMAVPLNGDAGSTRSGEGFDHLTVLEAWAEFTALSEAVVLTAGKIDLTNYFDNNLLANDETAQFLAAAFVNGSHFHAPAPGPGVRLRTVLLGRFSLQAGLASMDDAGSDLLDGLYKILGGGFRLFPGGEAEGNLRVYGYAPAGVGGDLGGGISFDQKASARVAGFARYGWNQESIAQARGIREAWSAGARLRVGALGRSAVAAAYGRAWLAAGGAEETAELYYRRRLNTWTYLSPHLQLLRSDRTAAGWRPVVGLRVHFNY